MPEMRNIAKIIVVIILIFILFLACLALFLDSPMELRRTALPVKFKVERGASVRNIVRNLKEHNLIRSENFAYIYLRLRNINIKSGTYNLKPSLPTSSILRNLTLGKQELTRITVPEGFTLKKTAKLFEEAGFGMAERFEELANDKEFLNSLGIDAESAEGFLFPDTYLLGGGESEEKIIKMMSENFFLKAAEINNFPSDFKKIYDKVVLASIIEREYQIPEEAPLISGVFENRLKIKMPLQSCATVEYIITEIQNKPHPKRLFWSDLEIKNEFNTYINYGLPPAPISNPGFTALNAACNPAKTEYLYFRLVDPEIGRHAFSKNLQEHSKAGNSLILKRNKDR